MPVFNNGKLQTYYRWEGLAEGPVLVLSHSLGCSSEMWQGQVKAFGDRFRILLYDHRGHGRSDVPAGHWTIGDFGKDLLAFLDHLALESVRFCGLSLGGMVGMWIAKNAHENNLTLRQSATQLGLVKEDQFNEWVKPEQMIGPKD